MGDMGAAMRAAGIKSSEELLREIAVEAWSKWPKAADSKARRDFLEARLDNAPGILYRTLIYQFAHDGVITQAMGTLLNRERTALESANPDRDAAPAAGRGGQVAIDTQRIVAPASTNSRDHARPQAERGSELARNIATPSSTTPARSTSYSEQERAAMMSRASSRDQRNPLNTVMVDGKPIGKCTVSEVRVWADQQMKIARGANINARFALNLIANLPGYTVIEERWKPEEAEQFYTSAENDYAS